MTYSILSRCKDLSRFPHFSGDLADLQTRKNDAFVDKIANIRLMQIFMVICGGELIYVRYTKIHQDPPDF